VSGGLAVLAMVVSLSMSEVTQRLGASPCWMTVAASDLVVKGTITGGDGQRAALRIDERLKGATDATSITIVNRTSTAGAPPAGSVIVFLQKPADAGPYYVTEIGEPGCAPSVAYSAEAAKMLTNEIERQKGAVAAFAQSAKPVSASAVFGKVKRDIESLVKSSGPGKKQSAFRKVLRRGTSAVPALIVLMDDDRSLCPGTVDVPAGPSAFEAVAHYSPETVFEAVDLALGNLTGISSDTLGSKRPAARDRVLAAWKVYFAYLQPQS